MMASEDKKTETSPAPKKEVPTGNKSTSGAIEGAPTPAASSSTYSRGEGQKPIDPRLLPLLAFQSKKKS